MELNKSYYGLMYKGRLFSGEATFYTSEGADKIISSTTDVEEAELFDNYDDAKEVSKKYNLPIVKLTVDMELVEGADTNEL